MANLKICVYTICKNEEKFVDRWATCCAAADYIVVLDTGSTDQTLTLFKKYPAIHIYQQQIIPWRFDVARNLALSQVPNDIDLCISLDMDEVLTPNWYTVLQENWQTDATAATCRSIWNFKADGSEDGVFWPNRIHRRHDYVWAHGIHEVLIYKGSSPEKLITIQNLEIHHHPDPTKERHYLTMLEQAVQDDPNDARDHFYLGREYLYHQDYEQAITTFSRYLELSSWTEERCAALVFIAKAYAYTHRLPLAISTLEQAIKEAPFIREPFIDLAYIYYNQQDYLKTLEYIERALIITLAPKGFISQGYAWDATPYDLGCIAHYQLGHLDASLAYAARCLSFSPFEKRFKDNLKLLQGMVISSICHQPLSLFTFYPLDDHSSLSRRTTYA